jgi:hypothetical protein
MPTTYRLRPIKKMLASCRSGRTKAAAQRSGNRRGLDGHSLGGPSRKPKLRRWPMTPPARRWTEGDGVTTPGPYPIGSARVTPTVITFSRRLLLSVPDRARPPKTLQLTRISEPPSESASPVPRSYLEAHEDACGMRCWRNFFLGQSLSRRRARSSRLAVTFRNVAIVQFRAPARHCPTISRQLKAASIQRAPLPGIPGGGLEARVGTW